MAFHQWRESRVLNLAWARAKKPQILLWISVSPVLLLVGDTDLMDAHSLMISPPMRTIQGAKTTVHGMNAVNPLSSSRRRGGTPPFSRLLNVVPAALVLGAYEAVHESDVERGTMI
ncbi:hypothetical protein B0H16DRAFT_1446055 [Mycena metata]|uniref:Uncharacterized protein n=1 Tax=Mycena metata TaxID=1033252 RepID=A0AAD7KI37_9AGAR|nr:hypothetical protein B0H16DRAFT_1446055 [Mycena metata]